MKRFITRIYSLDVFFPYSEKITVLFIELFANKVTARFVGGTTDPSIVLKHKFYSIVNLSNDLDYFNHMDNYTPRKEYFYKQCKARRQADGI